MQHSFWRAGGDKACIHILEKAGVCLFSSLTGPILKKHTPRGSLATPYLLWGPNPTACQLGEVTWWRVVQRNPAPAMPWDHKCLLAFNDPYTRHWWLARDLPCRLENWVKPKSSLVLNKDMLASLEQTVTECDQLPTRPALSGHTTLALALQQYSEHNSRCDHLPRQRISFSPEGLFFYLNLYKTW